LGGMLLKLSFFDKIGTFFDIIPKLVYFLSAVFLSAIDALQCLVRKLAGLDVYYVKQAGTSSLESVVQQDPLSEFIYGILGMGDSAPLYKGLNTVFWALTVFAILCLAVTTMIAIIKSHYNEDTAGTSPWKYVYTAFKAIMTFAIVPFAVIIGMEFASWTLRSLDSITAASANEEEIVSIYGGKAAQAFEASYLKGVTLDDQGQPVENQTDKYYTHYDFFGAGTPTSSTPFSGMLFKACAYDANRARNAGGDAELMTNIETSKGIKIFGQTSQYSSLQTDEEKAAYIADQVDYAFANNLYINGYIGGMQLTNIMKGMDVNVWSVTDAINGLSATTFTFTKWNVGFVWMFYNLWSYNFIVAFGGGVTIMGIMLSIIIGLMSRLMKGAVLFLIYPSLLGLAPLDNFKAFKSWSQQFIQQVLMAFGAIVGLNLALLVLPYVQNIKFFNIAVVDCIINIVLVITALILTKDIISMVSTFAGGADANNVGGGLKGEVGKAIATGAKVAGVAAVGAGAATAGIGMVAAKGVRGGIRMFKGRGGRAKAEMDDANNEVSTAKGNKKNAESAFYRLLGTSGNTNMFDEIAKVKKTDEWKDADSKGRKEIERRTMRQYYSSHKSEFDPSVETAEKRMFNAGLAVEKAQKRQGKVANAFHFREHKDSEGNITYDSQDRVDWRERRASKNAIFGSIRDGYTMEQGSDGKWQYRNSEGDLVSRKEARQGGVASVGQLFSALGLQFSDVFDKASIAEAGKHMADGFLKGVANLSSHAGLDKLTKGLGDIFKNGVEFKGGVFDTSDPKLEGDKLSAHQHKEEMAKLDKQASDTKELLKQITEMKQATISGNTKLAEALNKLTPKK